MTNALPFLVMTDIQAASFRDATLGAENRLEPRKVDTGPYAGQYVLPSRVMLDDAFADHADAFALLVEVVIDTDQAWPITDE